MKRRDFLITSGGVAVAAAAFTSTAPTSLPWFWSRLHARGNSSATKVWFTHSTLANRGRVVESTLVNTPGFVGCADLRSGECTLFEVPLFGHELIQNPSDPSMLFTSEKWGQCAALIDFSSRKVIAKIQNENGRRFFGHAQFALDGKSIFTAEMNDRTAEGLIAQRDLKTGAILNEYSSGGVLPHQLKWIREGQSLAVLNYAEGYASKPDLGTPVVENKRTPSSEHSSHIDSKARRTSGTGVQANVKIAANTPGLLSGGSKLTILTLDSKGAMTETESRLSSRPSLYHFDWDPTTDLAFASGNFEMQKQKALEPIRRTQSALNILAPSSLASNHLYTSSITHPATPFKDFDFARAGDDGFLGEALSVAACPGRSLVAVSLPEFKSLVIWDWTRDKLIQVERFSENARGVAFPDSETMLATVGNQMLVYKPSHGRWVETRRFPCGTGSHLTLGV